MLTSSLLALAGSGGRTSTAGLVMLNLFWTPAPDTARGQAWAVFWIMLVVIDIGSHWFHCIR